MEIKEIITSYKKGNSLDRLGIISNLVTIISAIVALLAGQLLTIKFVFDDTTFIRIAFYIMGMGVSLLLIYLFLWFVSRCNKIFTQYLLRISVILVVFGIMILIMFTIWDVILTIQ